MALSTPIMADPAGKAARKPGSPPGKPPGKPFVKGDPRINRTKPGPGRPPNAFKDFLQREIRDSDEARRSLVAAAMDPDCRNFAQAWKIATEYDDEKPAEKKQLSGALEIRVKIEREGRRLTAG